MASRVEQILPFQTATQPYAKKEGQSRIRTVIADDSAAFLEIVSLALGMEDEIELVEAASNGVEAVDAVARLRPALLIMDVHMPGLDGLAATSLVSAVAPAPLVVLMSSEDTPGLREACARSGAFAFLNKLTFQHQLPDLLDRIIAMRDQHWTGESA
jgi:DNA-binding NarL/FixJ family response regulator